MQIVLTTSKTFFIVDVNLRTKCFQYNFTALSSYAYVSKTFAHVVNLVERVCFPKKFPEKFWKFGNLPSDILGILEGLTLTNSFLRLCVCVYINFGINSSGRYLRKFGETTLFVKKFRNFGKFWKFLEIFGKF